MTKSIEELVVDIARQSDFEVTPDGRVLSLAQDEEITLRLQEFARRLSAATGGEREPVAGYVLVPIEPTPEMVAAMAVEEATGRINGVATLGMAGACLAYEAMLSAAPSNEALVNEADAKGKLPRDRLTNEDRLALQEFQQRTHGILTPADYWVGAIESLSKSISGQSGGGE